MIFNFDKKLALCILLLLPAVFADGPDETANVTTAEPMDASQNIYCPATENLVRDSVTGKWSAPGGWFSQNYSFADKIDYFLGAAYIGNEIGHVECYFTSNETGDVRIVLKNTKLVQVPAIEAWQPSEKDPKVKVCKQSSSSGCPFLIYDETKHVDSLEDTILNIPK